MVCWPTFCWWLCFCAPLFSFAAPQSITVLVNPGAWRRSFSSNWQPTTDSRLHSTDAWVAGAVDGAQWLTIDLGRPAQLQGIVTQGRSGYQQYVQSYRVELSLLGDSFAAVEGGRVLAGNGDAESAATALLARPVQARFVRLVPHTWHNWISLRAALLLVVELDDSGSRLNFSSVLPQPGQSGSQLGRLHSALAWSASSSSGEWALLELGGLYLVYGLATQGHAQQQQWVTSFRVLASEDGKSFTPVDQGALFAANFDAQSTVGVFFASPVLARSVRVLPVDVHGALSMRLATLASPVLDVPDGARAMSSAWPRLARSTLYSPASWSAGRFNEARVVAADEMAPEVWVRLDLGGLYRVEGLLTRGRQDRRNQQWVTAYSVQTSLDDAGWTSVEGGRLFAANTDTNSIATALFASPVAARYVRVAPRRWVNWISMRLAAMGSLAVANPPASRTASSVLLASGLGSELDGEQSWQAGVADAQQWLELNLRAPHAVAGLLTQGDPTSQKWVRSYRVQVSAGQQGGFADVDQGAVFAANSDNSGRALSLFAAPVRATRVRVLPTSWQGHIAMRVALNALPDGPSEGCMCNETTCSDMFRTSYWQQATRYDVSRCAQAVSHAAGGPSLLYSALSPDPAQACSYVERTTKTCFPASGKEPPYCLLQGADVADIEPQGCWEPDLVAAYGITWRNDSWTQAVLYDGVYKRFVELKRLLWQDCYFGLALGGQLAVYLPASALHEHAFADQGMCYDRPTCPC